MRCFFNLANGQDFLVDEKGIEVADETELRQEVAKAIEELRVEEPSAASTWRGWRLEVTGPSGSILFAIDLDPFRREAVAGWPFSSFVLLKSCELGEHFANVVAYELVV